jgi:hypothetical protein
MGRHAKNTYLNGNRVIDGVTASRPTDPVDGMIYWNTTTGELEIFDTTWVSIGISGTATIVHDTFVGDGSTAAYTMSQSVTSDEEIRVFIMIDNVMQNPVSAYTVSGTALTFTSPPPSLSDISVRHGFDTV